MTVPTLKFQERTPDVGWAQLMLLTLAVHIPHLGLVPVGVVVALWRIGRAWRALRHLRPARWLVYTATASLIMGAILRLALVGEPDGRLQSGGTAWQVTIWIAAFPLLGLAGAYALQVLGIRRGLFWVTVSAVIGTLAYYGLPAANPWKFSLSYPVAIAVFYLLLRSRRKLLPIIACLALGMVSVAYDSRNVTGAAIVTAVLVAVRPRQADDDIDDPARVRRHAALMFTLAAGGVALLWNGMKLGWLGSDLAATYARETAGGQNLILGGRVEFRVAAVLMQARPFGFGLGTTPSLALRDQSLLAVQAAGGDPNQRYYNFAVFADRTDMHSILSDLWFHAGWAGVLLAGALLVILVGGLIRAATARSVRPGLAALAMFGVAQAAWHVLFSPMGQVDQVGIGLALALALLVRAPWQPSDGAGVGDQPGRGQRGKQRRQGGVAAA